MKYLKYLRYLLRHIWFVRKACWANGLFWQGLVHDLSKFRPDEFVPYANFFYTPPKRNKTGYYKPTDTGDKKFDFAWLLHQKRNRHHWQFWLLPEDEGGIKILEMPEKYAKEMLCDWWGASMALGYEGKCRTWYSKNRDKMQLHPNTRAYVDKYVSDTGFGIGPVEKALVE